MPDRSPLHQSRQSITPALPKILESLETLVAGTGDPTTSAADQEKVQALFPKTYGQPIVNFSKGGSGKSKALRVGVVLSGGQASGGHNVICGLFDALKRFHPDSTLLGFLNGPSGITDNETQVLTADFVDGYRNTGGFDMIGSGRTKIESPEQFASALKTVTELGLDGVVVIGGDDSNTNAALLAEYFSENGSPTKVIGVPKTIDGDLKTEHVEISFGCDTACKTFSHIIGNITRDALSAKKYYYFIKLMGRSASHIALECALQTHANATLIGEEVEANKSTLQELTNQLADVVCARAKAGKNFGVFLIPEGIIEFIPEFNVLIGELNSLLAPSQPHTKQMESLPTREAKAEYISQQLTPESTDVFKSIPEGIQAQLLLDRDPHGNVQVAKIETERLFIETVKVELARREDYKGSFSAQPHYCGYEGRSCFPSNFDAQYCYALGHVAALLVHEGLTGYMACVRCLTRPTMEWEIAGIPITMLMNMEERHGKAKPVIKKALVELDGRPFKEFASKRGLWALNDQYRYPGPIQFTGDSLVTNMPIITLQLEQAGKDTVVSV